MIKVNVLLDKEPTGAEKEVQGKQRNLRPLPEGNRPVQ